MSSAARPLDIFLSFFQISWETENDKNEIDNCRRVNEFVPEMKIKKIICSRMKYVHLYFHHTVSLLIKDAAKKKYEIKREVKKKEGKNN